MSATTSTAAVPPSADVRKSRRRAEREAERRAQRLHSGLSGYWFLAPFAIVFLLFLIWPIVYGLWMSFTDRTLIGTNPGLVGLENYIEAFGDAQVWQTLWQTVFFTVISTIPLVIVALVMALLVFTGLPGQWLWRFAFFASFLLPVAVVTQVWGWMFQPDLGLFNTWLGNLGLDPVGWLTDERFAMWSIALVTVWWTVGFNFLLYLAALQAIPEHLYEAAAIDGAGAWRRLFSVTIPQLGRTTWLVLILQVLASLKVFDQIYLLTGGGPAGTTRSTLLYIYDTGFVNYRLGYASAISYIFFALIIVLSLIQLFNRRKEA
ncbi:binding-protein-dependent transport systems inner membrane component [Beutenbergia cavernae DSM 12333]|uniref:Binding-protein-dependent transport systems inner membrane component n=1 Tax=Beutenbergia cavernae (strain ATCC BAA-8 / DSM 12333 / CCUG 43141 / JCM 11478 / NBRC 16432 / NCIMB 13614 / HKI 0122) TaxID=471853 RepID=C5BZ05_BEUC1|nr:sugar ABC transporter permease [Beutenbergia cavernae]ACQ81120.1 binding-protein-dependent transport systems inner membrane component [Beutenbergia cavernae DSM 12333]